MPNKCFCLESQSFGVTASSLINWGNPMALPHAIVVEVKGSAVHLRVPEHHMDSLRSLLPRNPCWQPRGRIIPTTSFQPAHPDAQYSNGEPRELPHQFAEEDKVEIVRAEPDPRKPNNWLVRECQVVQQAERLKNCLGVVKVPGDPFGDVGDHPARGWGTCYIYHPAMKTPAKAIRQAFGAAAPFVRTGDLVWFEAARQTTPDELASATTPVEDLLIRQH